MMACAQPVAQCGAAGIETGKSHLGGGSQFHCPLKQFEVRSSPLLGSIAIRLGSARIVSSQAVDSADPSATWSRWVSALAQY